MRKRGLLLACIVLAMPAGCRSPASLEDWMREARSASYQPPDAAAQQALEQAFASALAGAVDADAWLSFGYELRLVSAGLAGGGAGRGVSEIAVREASPVRRGWGAYVLRPGPARALLLQAPHAESDRGSGRIAFALYEQTQARGFARNTAHRRLPQADLARAGASPFVLLARAAVQFEPDLAVVQIHGFGSATAQRHGLADDCVVASNGSHSPDPKLRAMAACLEASGFDVRLHPDEAAYPGGTRSAVGEELRRVGSGRFVHLELGSALRERLLMQPESMQSFAACL